MITDSFDEVFFLYTSRGKNNTLKTAHFDFLQIWGDADQGALQNRALKFFNNQRTRKFAV